MDVSATCNLACRDCYTKHTHTSGALSPERFRGILRKLSTEAKVLRKLHLNWRGEPFTNRRLPELLGIRNEILPDTPIELHTNGTYLEPAPVAEIIDRFRPGDLFYVSIDGGRREDHEANRGAGSWDAALCGLKNLLAARDSRGGSHPQIGIYEIDYGHRRRPDEELLRLGERCDKWTKVACMETSGREPSFVHPAIPRGPCFWAGHALCITAMGDVHVCLLSFRPDGVIGNIFDDDLAKILSNGRAFRERLRIGGRSSVPHCSGCRKTEGEMDES